MSKIKEIFAEFVIAYLVISVLSILTLLYLIRFCVITNITLTYTIPAVTSLVWYLIMAPVKCIDDESSDANIMNLRLAFSTFLLFFISTVLYVYSHVYKDTFNSPDLYDGLYQSLSPVMLGLSGYFLTQSSKRKGD